MHPDATKDDDSSMIPTPSIFYSAAEPPSQGEKVAAANAAQEMADSAQQAADAYQKCADASCQISPNAETEKVNIKELAHDSTQEAIKLLKKINRSSP